LKGLSPVIRSTGRTTASECAEVNTGATAKGEVVNAAEIVMFSSFDVTKLTAQNIADLSKDGNDLRRFQML